MHKYNYACAYVNTIYVNTQISHIILCSLQSAHMEAICVTQTFFYIERAIYSQTAVHT